MDNVLNQLRVRFLGLGQDEDYYNAEEAQRKTGSFKGERKRSQNRSGQYSGRMNYSDYSSDGEFATTIAAAAHAIRTTEEENQEEESVRWRNSVKESAGTQKKTNSKKQDSFSKPSDSKKMIRWLSGKNAKQDQTPGGEISMRNPPASEKNTREEITWERNITVEKLPDKMPSTKPGIHRTPTFPDNKYPRKAESKKIQNEKDAARVPNAAFPVKPATPARKNQTRVSKYETEADAWERTEMEKIRKRYEKMSTTILDWEDEKKTKAKRRLERKEREIEARRARAVTEYRNEVTRIDKIASGARALAEERKRNEESKTIEKANKIRASARMPSSCSCF